MPAFNKVILAGNLTRDPELKHTPKGTAVCKFSIAINRKWRDDAGQEQEDVTFVEIDAWGRTAETIAKHLTKGRPILIDGRLKLDTWDDKQTGQKRSRLGVVCESFQFLDSGGTRQGGSPGTAPSVARPAPSSAAQAPGEPEDDVPF